MAVGNGGTSWIINSANGSSCTMIRLNAAIMAAVANEDPDVVVPVPAIPEHLLMAVFRNNCAYMQSRGFPVNVIAGSAYMSYASVVRFVIRRDGDIFKNCSLRNCSLIDVTAPREYLYDYQDPTTLFDTITLSHHL